MFQALYIKNHHSYGKIHIRIKHIAILKLHLTFVYFISRKVRKKRRGKTKQRVLFNYSRGSELKKTNNNNNDNK